MPGSCWRAISINLLPRELDDLEPLSRLRGVPVGELVRQAPSLLPEEAVRQVRTPPERHLRTVVAGR